MHLKANEYQGIRESLEARVNHALEAVDVALARKITALSKDFQQWYEEQKHNIARR